MQGSHNTKSVVKDSVKTGSMLYGCKSQYGCKVLTTQNTRRKAVSNRAKDMHETSQRCTEVEVPLQVQGSEKMKLEVHGMVRELLRVVNSYKIRRKVHNSVTAGAR